VTHVMQESVREYKRKGKGHDVKKIS